MVIQVEIETSYVTETDDAILIDEFDKQIWIPKGVIEDGYNLGFFQKDDPIAIVIPEWFAHRNDLI